MSNPPVLAQPEPTVPIPPDVPKGLRLTDVDLRMHGSRTARRIAIALVVMLGLTIILDYGTMIVLTVYNRLDAAPLFDKMFAVWIPLLSGLVGSALTFYFTKEKR